MGLSWQQGPLGNDAVGRFLTPEPLPQRLLYAEPLRRRMRVKLGETWVAESEDVVLLHEPGRYPVAYFPLDDVRDGTLLDEARVTRHKDLGETRWFTVTGGGRVAEHAAWSHVSLAQHAGILRNRVAFAWRAMDAFYEEDERIVGHAADPYHRIDIRESSRRLLVLDGERRIAETRRPLVLYESGFAPRWYVRREDIDMSRLALVSGQTFCPYKGLASYYDVGARSKAAWSYVDAWPEVARVSNLISFEPNKIDVFLDGVRLVPQPGQSVTPHGIDRGLDPAEMLEGPKPPGA